MEVLSRLRRVFGSLVPGGAPASAGRLPAGEPRRTDSLVPGGDDGGAVVASLQSAGVLVEQGQELVLSTGFREQWREEIGDLRVLDDEALAGGVATAAPGVDRAVVVEEAGREFVVVDRGGDEPLWLSRAVAIAEVAALRALPEAVPPEHRLSAARPLRLFLEECPDCGGRVDAATAEDWPAANRLDQSADELLVCWECGEILYAVDDGGDHAGAETDADAEPEDAEAA